MEQKQQARSRWLAAGRDALARGGEGAVRVEPLAAALGITKGSFYWHFRDRAALLAAIVGAWEAEQTHAVIERVEASGGTAAARLHLLVDVVLASRTTEAALELALRDWARRDRDAHAALERVDAQRLDYVERLLCELGCSILDARARARLLYAALLGEPLVALRLHAVERAALRARCVAIVVEPITRVPT